MENKNSLFNKTTQDQASDKGRDLSEISADGAANGTTPAGKKGKRWRLAILLVILVVTGVFACHTIMTYGWDGTKNLCSKSCSNLATPTKNF